MGKDLVTVKYIGHLAAFDLDPDGFGEKTFVAGEPINVPAELAASLLEQVNNWVLVEDTPVAPAKASLKASATTAGKADSNAEEAN